MKIVTSYANHASKARRSNIFRCFIHNLCENQINWLTLSIQYFDLVNYTTFTYPICLAFSTSILAYGNGDILLPVPYYVESNLDMDLALIYIYILYLSVCVFVFVCVCVGTCVVFFFWLWTSGNWSPIKSFWLPDWFLIPSILWSCVFIVFCSWKKK